ncbi:MAG: EamA family transporter RarD, partial [Caldilineaceae bacterium]|nr:EamA family transporter RarD [Caldilineaceae bacterium]
MSAHERRGALLALACYMSWGFFPIYFRLLAPVPTIDILANRMVWSLGLVLLILAIRRDWSWIGPALSSRESMLTFGGAALLLTANWFTYIWAVNAGYVIESSLGYFVNPLVSVLLAVFFLHERPRAGQWIANVNATAAELCETNSNAQLPWIAMGMALTLGFYGLLKKRARLNALHGL